MGELLQLRKPKQESNATPTRRSILLQFQNKERRRKPGPKRKKLIHLTRTRQYGSHGLGADDFDRWVDNVTHMF